MCLYGNMSPTFKTAFLFRFFNVLKRYFLTLGRFMEERNCKIDNLTLHRSINVYFLFWKRVFSRKNTYPRFQSHVILG